MSIPKEHIEKLCTKKHQYNSKRHAESKIKIAKKRGKIISSTLRVYKCLFCWAWHVGHLRTVDKKGNPV